MATDTIRLSAHSSLTGFRDGDPAFVTESPRDGLASSAELVGDLIRQELIGRPVQGERDTLTTCRELISYLNDRGASWSEPREGVGSADCVACSEGMEDLEVQVVRAIADPSFWVALARSAEATESMSLDACVSRLHDAIQHKLSPEKLAPSARASLHLVLDANRVPAMAFPQVAARFKERHGEWVATLGFAGVWVVGPTKNFVHQLG